MFQVAVGDGASAIGGGYKASLDLKGEGVLPDVGQPSWAVDDSPHARFGGVSGTREARVLRD